MGIKPKAVIKSNEIEKSVRLEVEGDYVGLITNARFIPDGNYPDAWFIDFKVESGPEAVGKPAAWALFLKAQYKNIPTGKGGIFTAKQQLEADQEKVQVAFAAALGLTREQAGELAEGGTHEGAMEKCFDEGNAEDVIGRRVHIRVKRNKNGYPELTLFPYFEEGAASVSQKPAAAPAKPKAPPAPAKAKPTFEQAYKAAGFVHREDAPGWYWNETTEEQLDDADLRAKLGFDEIPF